MNEGYSNFIWRLDIQNTDTQQKRLSINYSTTTLTIVCQNAECRIFKLYAVIKMNVVILSVFMQNAFMRNVIMINIVMQNVLMLNVVLQSVAMHNAIIMNVVMLIAAASC